MTILRPQKTSIFINAIIVSLSVFVALSAALGVLLYNSAVSLDYDIEKTKRAIEIMEIENAKLRQRLSEVADTDRIKNEMENFTLVKDRNPRYLSAQQEPALGAR